MSKKGVFELKINFCCKNVKEKPLLVVCVFTAALPGCYYSKAYGSLIAQYHINFNQPFMVKKLNWNKQIGKLVVLYFVMLAPRQLPAQVAGFEQAATKLQLHIFSGDTALYNQKKICFFDIRDNGNVQIATRGDQDTLQFNLLLLHPLAIDSSGNYNQHGMGVYGSSIDLFIEETSSSHEFNEKGEIVVTHVMLPVFEIKFENRLRAKQVADLLVRLRSYCRLNEQAYRRKTNGK